MEIVQLGLKLNTKLGLDHHHPPTTHQPQQTFLRVLDLVGGRARKNIFWLVPNFFGMKLAARFFGRNDNIFPLPLGSCRQVMIGLCFP